MPIKVVLPRILLTTLPSVVLQWDASGEILALLPAGCSFVYTWTAATKELQKLETDFKASDQQQACQEHAAAASA